VYSIRPVVIEPAGSTMPSQYGMNFYWGLNDFKEWLRDKYSLEFHLSNVEVKKVGLTSEQIINHAAAPGIPPIWAAAQKVVSAWEPRRITVVGLYVENRGAYGLGWQGSGLVVVCGNVLEALSAEKNPKWRSGPVGSQESYYNRAVGTLGHELMHVVEHQHVNIVDTLDLTDVAEASKWPDVSIPEQTLRKLVASPFLAAPE
jgi:hypothetical protein